MSSLFRQDQDQALETTYLVTGHQVEQPALIKGAFDGRIRI